MGLVHRVMTATKRGSTPRRPVVTLPSRTWYRWGRTSAYRSPLAAPSALGASSCPSGCTAQPWLLLSTAPKCCACTALQLPIHLPHPKIWTFTAALPIRRTCARSQIDALTASNQDCHKVPTRLSHRTLSGHKDTSRAVHAAAVSAFSLAAAFAGFPQRQQHAQRPPAAWRLRPPVVPHMGHPRVMTAAALLLVVVAANATQVDAKCDTKQPLQNVTERSWWFLATALTPLACMHTIQPLRY